MITKPMLAGKVVGPLQFPLLVSPKLDGIRCIVDHGEVLSRSFKQIPNKHIQSCLKALDLKNIALDGELMLKNPQASFQEVCSAVMSEDGEPSFIYHVFDAVTDGLNVLPFHQRLAQAAAIVRSIKKPYVKIVEHRSVIDHSELTICEEDYLQRGFEGLMIRDPLGPYKCGRSTTKEAYLLKLKRFEDAEAVVIGFDEAMANTNEATIGELGQTKRSTKKAGRRAKNTLGALVVKMSDGLVLRVGTGKGLTDELKKEIWSNRKRYLGQLIKFRYQQVGTKDSPRIPSFQGFRAEADL